MDAIDKAIDAGIKVVDLYEVGRKDVIRREDIREFLEAALRAWLKGQESALNQNEKSPPKRSLSGQGSVWHRKEQQALI